MVIRENGGMTTVVWTEKYTQKNEPFPERLGFGYIFRAPPRKAPPGEKKFWGTFSPGINRSMTLVEWRDVDFFSGNYVKCDVGPIVNKAE